MSLITEAAHCLCRVLGRRQKTSKCCLQAACLDKSKTYRSSGRAYLGKVLGDADKKPQSGCCMKVAFTHQAHQANHATMHSMSTTMLTMPSMPPCHHAFHVNYHSKHAIHATMHFMSTIMPSMHVNHHANHANLAIHTMI